MLPTKLTIKKLYTHNQDAFCDIYNAYHNLVYFVINSIIKNEEDTKELVQDTFIKMWNKIHLFDINSNFKAWLITIAKNTTKDHLRKAKPLEYLDDNRLETVKKTKIINELLIDSKGIINRLEYEILVLSIIYDFKRKEVAEILDKPLGTILRAYKEGLDKLKNFYEVNENKIEKSIAIKG